MLWWRDNSLWFHGVLPALVTFCPTLAPATRHQPGAALNPAGLAWLSSSSATAAVQKDSRHRGPLIFFQNIRWWGQHFYHKQYAFQWQTRNQTTVTKNKKVAWFGGATGRCHSNLKQAHTFIAHDRKHSTVTALSFVHGNGILCLAWVCSTSLDRTESSFMQTWTCWAGGVG